MNDLKVEASNVGIDRDTKL